MIGLRHGGFVSSSGSAEPRCHRLWPLIEAGYQSQDASGLTRGYLNSPRLPATFRLPHCQSPATSRRPVNRADDYSFCVRFFLHLSPTFCIFFGAPTSNHGYGILSLAYLVQFESFSFVYAPCSVVRLHIIALVSLLGCGGSSTTFLLPSFGLALLGCIGIGLELLITYIDARVCTLI
jgi:hypothetical protein